MSKTIYLPYKGNSIAVEPYVVHTSKSPDTDLLEPIHLDLDPIAHTFQTVLLKWYLTNLVTTVKIEQLENAGFYFQKDNDGEPELLLGEI